MAGMKQHPDYPPPNLPEKYEWELARNGDKGYKNPHTGYKVPAFFYRIYESDNPDSGSAAWIDCADNPEYWVRNHADPRQIADSYAAAQAHIEALAWLGELE